MMCVRGCATLPFGSLLSPASPAPLTSGRQDCVSSLGRGETGVTPSCCFLGSQAEFEPTVRPAPGLALDSEASSLFTVPAPWSQQQESHCFHLIRDLGVWGTAARGPAPGGGGQGNGHLLTHTPRANLLPRRSLPASPGSLPV